MSLTITLQVSFKSKHLFVSNKIRTHAHLLARYGSFMSRSSFFPTIKLSPLSDDF